jgi:hypothetical protein
LQSLAFRKPTTTTAAASASEREFDKQKQAKVYFFEQEFILNTL